MNPSYAQACVFARFFDRVCRILLHSPAAFAFSALPSERPFMPTSDDAFGKFLGVEQLEIVQLFARSDKQDGDVQLAAQRYD